MFLQIQIPFTKQGVFVVRRSWPVPTSAEVEHLWSKKEP